MIVDFQPTYEQILFERGERDGIAIQWLRNQPCSGLGVTLSADVGDSPDDVGEIVCDSVPKRPTKGSAIVLP
jgi:hypothetical protein